ncbi:uncharacterized protein [Dermacentor andersoni]|uniref:uncharacterized protein n=1 Tax=Dermacentor andersoni TaxID=34620 RepID=UPI003B3AE16C
MEAMLPAFPPFDLYTDPTSLAQRWTKWQARFENFLLAANIQNAARKRAMLLHYAGDAVHDIFLTLPDRGTDYETAVAKLNAHFAPRKNAVYERHVFRQAKQTSEETVDQFQVRLRRLAATCEFANEEEEIVSRMIEGTNSAKLRRSALRERDVTLEKIMEIGRSLETAEFQATSMEGRERVEPVQKVTKKKQWRRSAPSSNQCVNVIGETTWQKHLQTMQLEHTTTKLVPYGVTQEIPVMGKFSATFRALDQVIEATVYVVKGTHRSLLSYKTASDLKLITILQLVTEHSSVDAKKEFPKLFGKVGRLKNFQVKLNISQDVQPVVRQHRRIPFQMRKALETELTHLEELDIIEKVTGSTP